MEIVTWKMYISEIADFPSWKSCHLGNCHLGKCTFEKLPLGKLHIWEVTTWENTPGKLPFGKRPLGKYLTLLKHPTNVQIIKESNYVPPPSHLHLHS